MIADDLRLALVEAISKIPLAVDQVGRTTLLAGIPKAGFLTRNPANDRGDVMVLVLQLEETYGPNREWRLLQLIDNAAASIPGTDLAKQLAEIRRALLEAARPRNPRAAETAQVHLFDLRQPVMMCVGQLPRSGGMSGFVVPAATPRLLRYFCDSLQHRGAEYGAWTRDLIAATRSPVVIGPLQTAISVALTQAKRVESLLAVKHVLWPAYVESEADANALWQGLNATFTQPPQTHLVVVFGMPDGVGAPASMKQLPSPAFTPHDVSNWGMDIAKANAWNDALVKRWTTVIVMGYTSGGPLPVDIVYDRLERYHGLVNEYRDDEQGLLRALQELELIGD
jgi:hypothetical protein